MSQMKVLGLCGSLRKGSLNSKLIHEAVRLHAGAALEEADLNLPLYDGDVEQATGIPASVRTLADQITAADAVLVATPEYNKSLSGVLKNALDWVSRVEGNPWEAKPVGLLSATAGRTGGEAAQFALRLAMVSFRPRIVLTPPVLVAGAMKEFDEAGQLSNEQYINGLKAMMAALQAQVETSTKL